MHEADMQMTVAVVEQECDVAEEAVAGSVCGGPEAQPGRAVACTLQRVMAGPVVEDRVESGDAAGAGSAV